MCTKGLGNVRFSENLACFVFFYLSFELRFDRSPYYQRYTTDSTFKIRSLTLVTEHKTGTFVTISNFVITIDLCKNIKLRSNI